MFAGGGMATATATAVAEHTQIARLWAWALGAQWPIGTHGPMIPTEFGSKTYKNCYGTPEIPGYVSENGFPPKTPFLSHEKLLGPLGALGLVVRDPNPKPQTQGKNI